MTRWARRHVQAAGTLASECGGEIVNGWRLSVMLGVMGVLSAVAPGAHAADPGAAARSPATRPVLVRDIVSGPSSSFPGVPTATVDDLRYFVVEAPGQGQLWRTDGTARGTLRIHRGRVDRLVVLDGRVLFVAEAPGADADRTLWVSNGTPKGTSLLHDPGPEAGIADLVVAGDTAFFTSSTYDPTSGLPSFQLWATDGTPEGSRLLRGFDTPVSHRDLADLFECLDHGCVFTAVGDRLFFIAEDRTSGAELWTSDGTAEGTVLVRDIVPGPAATFSEASYETVDAGLWVGLEDQWMRSVDGRLLFIRPIDGGAQLWTSDGTEVGTTHIADLPCLPPLSVSLGDRAVFVLGGDFCPPVGSAGDVQLWSSDGTPTGTSPVGIIPDPGDDLTSLCSVRGRAVFLAQHPSGGVALWSTDGSDAGTPLLRDTRRAILGPAGDLVVLSIEPAGPKHPAATWVSDGTATGTVRVSGVLEGSWLGRIGATLIGSGRDARHGHELWKVTLPRRVGAEAASTVECSDWLG